MNIKEAIESMDKRHKRNVLDNPSIMKSYGRID